MLVDILTNYKLTLLYVILQEGGLYEKNNK